MESDKIKLVNSYLQVVRNINRANVEPNENTKVDFDIKGKTPNYTLVILLKNSSHNFPAPVAQFDRTRSWFEGARNVSGGELFEDFCCEILNGLLLEIDFRSGDFSGRMNNRFKEELSKKLYKIGITIVNVD